MVDGAQSVSHRKVDVQDLDCDFFAFSAHKMYGPTGIGVLYGKQEWLEKLPPYQGGGEMIGTVSFEKTTYNDPPYKFEAGTPNYIGVVGLTEAIHFIQSVGVEAIEKYEQQLTDYATEQLKQIEGLTIYGEAEHKTSVISFRVEGVHPLDLATLLDKIGIAVRTGHHCAEPLMHRLGIEGTVRASFAVYNTFQEVDALVAGIRRIYGMLCK
jgi:cysteine desulfurase/selenocysteine lyase